MECLEPRHVGRPISAVVNSSELAVALDLSHAPQGLAYRQVPMSELMGQTPAATVRGLLACVPGGATAVPAG